MGSCGFAIVNSFTDQRVIWDKNNQQRKKILLLSIFPNEAASIVIGGRNYDLDQSLGSSLCILGTTFLSHEFVYILIG